MIDKLWPGKAAEPPQQVPDPAPAPQPSSENPLSKIEEILNKELAGQKSYAQRDLNERIRLLTFGVQIGMGIMEAFYKGRLDAHAQESKKEIGDAAESILSQIEHIHNLASEEALNESAVAEALTGMTVEVQGEPKDAVNIEQFNKAVQKDVQEGLPPGVPQALTNPGARRTVERKVPRKVTPLPNPIQESPEEILDLDKEVPREEEARP